MHYVSEFREKDPIQKISQALHALTTKKWTIMEVCGGQTHSIVKYGLHDLLPKNIELIHGPGCPVCVTADELIEQALHIAVQPNTIVCSFGDMLRVPANGHDLLTLKAKGADVRIVQSPLQALTIAEQNKNKEVVFFGVGFETTAPATAMAVHQAYVRQLVNFSLLASHVLVPPALKYILDSEGNQVQGFLAAGHVCTIDGYQEYHHLASYYTTPIVVTGFEPLDILQGIYHCVQLLEKKTFKVINQYSRCVQEAGNPIAKKLILEVFDVIDRPWRGMGIIPQSGLGIKNKYQAFDAMKKFPFKAKPSVDTGCISGLIMQGKKKPKECPLFGRGCTPETPLGAPMVSSEGACSAYYQFHQNQSDNMHSLSLA
jgi:hydrogenase expression/formation protein HypD